MYVSKVTIVAAALSFLAVPSQALDLGLGVGSGDTSVSVGASQSASGASASVGVSLGGTSASVGAGLDGSADVDLGIGTTPATALPAGLNGDPMLVPFASFIGRDVLSRDRVLLGEVTDLKESGGACPVLGLSPAANLPVSADRVWLRMNSCSAGTGAIKLSTTSGNFVSSLRN